MGRTPKTDGWDGYENHDEPVFVEELPPGGGWSWVPTLELLVARPNEWAEVAQRPDAESARTLAGHLRNGRLGGQRRPAGKFSFAARTLDGKNRVYGRYDGE